MSARPIETVCVVGAGFMGWQISLHCAAKGFTVPLVHRSMGSRERAQAAQAAEMDRCMAQGEITSSEKAAILSRLRYTQDLAESAGSADLVIEAVNERLEPKRELFARLDAICPPHAILTTTSSSIRISRIEDATRRPDKVVNLHFYHWPWHRPMLDLMGGTATSQETMARVERFVRDLDIVPLVARKESTGFVHNRVWRAVKREVLHLVDDGVASFEDVDRAWMISYGQPIGPFGKMDLIGLDVIRDIEMVYHQESGDPADAPPRLLLDRIERGELGVKTGKGFYTYPHPAFEEPGWLMAGEEQ